MPMAKVRGANINYEGLGTHGPWLALSPGGRRALDNVKSLAQRVADQGYRVARFEFTAAIQKCVMQSVGRSWSRQGIVAVNGIWAWTKER